MRKALAGLAVLFLASHLACLPSTLDDIDPINFALGVRDFDVARHQPHPPGYPIFIAAAKISTAAFSALNVAGPEARGLAFWSAVGGALLIPGLFMLFRALDGSPRAAGWATLLTVSSPLLWFTALRPLSDVPGLAAAVFAQAFLIQAIRDGGSTRPLVAGALLTGLSIGVRSQNFTLTLPLLAVALVRQGDALAPRTRLVALGALAVGILAWAGPLLIASGGLTAYLDALARQGGQDFSGVVMFWNFPTAAVGLSALQHAFVSPWNSPPLALLVLMAAAAGLLAIKARGRLWILGVAAAPYAIFHLLFHETVTVRYALPLVPAVAWLAVRGIERFASAALPLIVGVMTIWSLVVVVPAGVRYATSRPPIFRAIDDLSAARQVQPVVAASHRRIWSESDRARQWLQEPPRDWLPAPRYFEWLRLTRAWREGRADAAWFFVNPPRTDLALIDAHGSQLVPYRWSVEHGALLGGVRPDEFDVRQYAAPGWFLEEGWALTPEVAGVSAREGWMPHLRPSAGWVRRRDGAADMVLGGRHLGAPGTPPVRIVATIDGLTVHDREVARGFFMDRIPLPPGLLAGDGRYAALTVHAVAGAGSAPVVLEQFDLQSDGVPMSAFDQGWYEPHFEPGTTQVSRWMGPRGTLWVRPIGRDVTLTLTAASPRPHFDTPPLLRASVGGREIARLSPSSAFTWTMRIPAALLVSGGDRVIIRSDRMFAPGGEDQRQLALRVYSVTVE